MVVGLFDKNASEKCVAKALVTSDRVLFYHAVVKRKKKKKKKRKRKAKWKEEIRTNTDWSLSF